MLTLEPGLYWYWDHPSVLGPEIVQVIPGDPPVNQQRVLEHGREIVGYLHELSYPGQFLGPLVPPERPKDAEVRDATD